MKVTMQDALFVVYQRTSTVNETMTVSVGSPDQLHHTSRLVKGVSSESISAENGEPKRVGKRDEDMVKEFGGVDGRGRFMKGGREEGRKKGRSRGLHRSEQVGSQH
jgi:hypothetical protein